MELFEYIKFLLSNTRIQQKFYILRIAPIRKKIKNYGREEVVMGEKIGVIKEQFANASIEENPTTPSVRVPSSNS